MYPIVQVDSSRAVELEPLGTKRKFWYTDGSRRVLFKAEERGTGEDWAEKLACELCTLLGLPHVHYELALDTHSQHPGVVCESCATGYTGLALGNQLLLERDSFYPANEGQRYRVCQHTVEAVIAVLATVSLPPMPWAIHLPLGVLSALDVFAGYVMLDAWIANQDRHHENWGALRQGLEVFLAPSFDHGASLARNLSDAERQERLETRDTGRQVPSFARRARSAFFGGPSEKRPMTTLEAWHAFAARAPRANAAWLDRLRQVSESAIREIVRNVPPQRMSGICQEFTVRLLVENQARILTGAEK
jgi:hypothetical protein